MKTISRASSGSDKLKRQGSGTQGPSGVRTRLPFINSIQETSLKFRLNISRNTHLPKAAQSNLGTCQFLD